MTSPFIDFQVIFSYIDSDNDLTLVIDLLEYFKKHAPERLENFRNSISTKDYKHARFNLHSLKNSFLNIGALRAADHCQEIEDNIESISEADLVNHNEQIANYISVSQEIVSHFIDARNPNQHLDGHPRTSSI